MALYGELNVQLKNLEGKTCLFRKFILALQKVQVIEPREDTDN